jgi:hypothetical protein
VRESIMGPPLCNANFICIARCEALWDLPWTVPAHVLFLVLLSIYCPFRPHVSKWHRVGIPETWRWDGDK